MALPTHHGPQDVAPAQEATQETLTEEEDELREMG